MSTQSTPEPRKLKRSTEYLIVVAMVTAMVVVLQPIVRSQRNPNGPHGEMIPSAAPDEARRIRNASGLSIVLPENWEVKDFGDPKPTYLYTYARGTPGRRLKAYINVELLGDKAPQDLKAFTATTFQGSPAYERMVVEREDTFDDPARSLYTMYFQHEGKWWSVNYGIAQRCEVLPEMVRRYINTIRWETVP